MKRTLRSSGGILIGFVLLASSGANANTLTCGLKTVTLSGNTITKIVHEDGTARPQIVTAKSNPRYYELLRKFEAKTGVGVLLNTSLNRRGEPMVCSPDDALNMFYGSDLQNLALGDFLVRKQS